MTRRAVDIALVAPGNTSDAASPLVGVTVSFRVERTFLSADGPVEAGHTLQVTTDASGHDRAWLECPTSGAGLWTATTPYGTYAFSLAAGDPITLDNLIATGITVQPVDVVQQLLSGYATTDTLLDYILKTSLPLAGTAPTTGQVLMWNGTAWAPASTSATRALEWKSLTAYLNVNWAYYGTPWEAPQYAIETYTSTGVGNKRRAYLRGAVFRSGSGTTIFQGIPAELQPGANNRKIIILASQTGASAIQVQASSTTIDFYTGGLSPLVLDCSYWLD